MDQKAIVLDANILIRAVLGTRARELVLENSSRIKFFAPDVAYDDARKYLPPLLKKRGVEAAVPLHVLKACRRSFKCSTLRCMPGCGSAHWNASGFVTPTTGLCDDDRLPRMD